MRRVGPPPAELCAPSTSQRQNARIKPQVSRSVVVARATRDASVIQNLVSSPRAASARPASTRPVPAPAAKVETYASLPPTSTFSGRLQSWLPWSSSSAASIIPLASELSPAGCVSHDEAAMLGDGMASASAAPPPPKPRRSWSVMSRRSSGGAATTTSSASSSAPASALPHQGPVRVDHATLQVLRQRVLARSAPGARQDNFKLGLVVEGGGMRGCVSGGALQALDDANIRNAFDAVYGSSAGAINASFFLAKQLDGVNIYHDHIASEEFIDLRRLLSRRPGLPPALNLDYLLDHVMRSVHPLDHDAVLASPIPLKIAASSLDSLSPVLLQDFVDKHDLFTSMRASATVPEVAGGPVNHRGHRLVDAAVFEAVPFRSAIADGCTHVLVLCTRPAPQRKSYLDQALADAVEAAVKRAVMSPEYMRPAWKAEVETLVKDGLSQDEMLLRSFDEDAEQLPWFAGSHVFPVYPSSPGAAFSPLCTDVPTLKAGVAEGRRAALRVMRAVLGDIVDFSKLTESEFEATNIVPIPQRKGRFSSSREKNNNKLPLVSQL